MFLKSCSKKTKTKHFYYLASKITYSAGFPPTSLSAPSLYSFLDPLISLTFSYSSIPWIDPWNLLFGNHLHDDSKLYLQPGLIPCTFHSYIQMPILHPYSDI